MSNENKTVIVTGGSRGLGKDMALQIAQKGFSVILTYHSKKNEADSVVQQIKSNGGQAISLQLDVTQTTSYPDFVSKVEQTMQSEFNSSTLHGLVNNAGYGLHADISNTSEEQFDEMVQVHLKAPFFLTQKLYPLMSNGGSIVNISSGLARFTFTGYDAYATMKGGVETLTRYQAKFLGSKGIRVNTVAPGAIETDFGGGAVRDNKDLNQMLSDMTALGRVGLPNDIGSVVAFLCSDESKWVNAQRIEVAGGILI